MEMSGSTATTELPVNDHPLIVAPKNETLVLWQRFGLQTFREYHDLYLRLDVLLLADAFERFRHVFMTGFGLDPCHYYTLPGAGWDAAMRTTGEVLELFGPGEEDKYIFCEESKRGGVSIVGALRYAEANNPYLADYEESRPTSYLILRRRHGLFRGGGRDGTPHHPRRPVRLSGFP